MRAWRICRRERAARTLEGRGGTLASGRWHTRGRPIVYTSGSLSLASLEMLVHVDADLAPADLVSVEINVPDDLRMVEVRIRDLPPDWRDTPAPSRLQAEGDAWLGRGRSAVLKVPSAVIPSESNHLIHPGHEDSRRIAVVRIAAFAFDPRLLRGRRR